MLIVSQDTTQQSLVTTVILENCRKLQYFNDYVDVGYYSVNLA